MTTIVGYKLINTQDGSVIQSWGGVWGECPGVPAMLRLPNGDHVHAPTVGESYSGFTLSELHADEPAPTKADVDRERDRRMGMFVFGGLSYDLSGQSLVNVAGAGTLSLAALINGAQPGDLRWADPDQDFSWIAHDNTIVAMDAQTCWAFAQTAAVWRKHCIFKARALKEMNAIPSDYMADSYWE